MSIDVRFEPMGPDDFATVADLGERIWRQHYSTIVSMEQVEYMLARRYTPENLARYVGASDRGMFVVRTGAGGRAVGYFSYKAVDGDELKLEQLYLLEELRGRGIGARMMEHVEAEARARGCGRVMLTVNKRNEGSIAVYAKRGYVVRESAVFDIGGGYVMDDYVMEKRL